MISIDEIPYQRHFYPRSPCGERRVYVSYNMYNTTFLSTLSLRRATLMMLSMGVIRISFLSTLSLRRATFRVRVHLLPSIFLSTLSLRRATPSVMQEIAQQRISIHALLAESDHPRLSDTAPHIYFYPRSPCGERRIDSVSNQYIPSFLSTLSLRRATRLPRYDNLH